VGVAAVVIASVGIASVGIAYICRGSCYEFSPCSAFGEQSADNELILMSAKLREQLLKACLITFKEGRTIPILKENSSSQNNKAESTLRVRCPVPFAS
jgi:hypothetical protein